MQIRMETITLGELADGYTDRGEDGVKAFGGLLDVRPPYQREFVYKDDKRDAVVRSVMAGLPINVMYWADNGNGTYSVLDGQQRTVSLCTYIAGSYSVGEQYFHNLSQDRREAMLAYGCTVYICKGTSDELLEWFRTINIASVALNDQELRNAAYTGPWLADAKRYFSRTNCPAKAIGGDLMAGSPIRQDYLEAVISWLAYAEGKSIERYMAEHQHDRDATPMWTYFKGVVEWVRRLFPVYRSEMKGRPWGEFAYDYMNDPYVEGLYPDIIEEVVGSLMEDEDVTSKSGIYEYVLGGDERRLSIRRFPPRDRRAAYERQGGDCARCGRPCPIEEMEADHIVPWSRGGHTVPTNCQMLCRECNRAKSDD